MGNKIYKMLMVFTIIGFLIYPNILFAKEKVQKWKLVNPESVIKIEPMEVNSHPDSLKGKTIVLRSNGKHNADNFLDVVATMLNEKVRDIKIIKAWELSPETNTISQNPGRSIEIAEKIASFNPDLVIGSQGD